MSKLAKSTPSTHAKFGLIHCFIDITDEDVLFLPEINMVP